MCVCAPMYTLEIPVCELCIHLSIHTVHYFINIPHAHRYGDCAHENTDITVAYSSQTLLSRPVVYRFTRLFYTVCLQFYQPISYCLFTGLPAYYIQFVVCLTLQSTCCLLFFRFTLVPGCGSDSSLSGFLSG